MDTTLVILALIFLFVCSPIIGMLLAEDKKEPNVVIAILGWVTAAILALAILIGATG